jgi:hypothetical protein
MTYEKPDGVIEYGCSGCCCPPGERRAGLHTNSGTSWYRVKAGPWKGITHLGDFRTFAAASETCAEFSLAMEVW